MSEYAGGPLRALSAMNDLISHMENCGWAEVADGAGYKIVNPKVTDEEFDSWGEAIKSCIEVASDV